MDKMTKLQRRKCMQSIKSKNTKPEMLLRKALWKLGYRYRIHNRKLPGNPDIVFSKYKVAIFCDGSFWHGYNWEQKKLRISSNKEYWIPKIEKNMQRDRQNNQLLKAAGWHVLRFWDFHINKELENCIDKIIKVIQSLKV